MHWTPGVPDAGGGASASGGSSPAPREGVPGSAAGPASLAVPQVPGYRLDRVLGRGAGGLVWRAQPADGGDGVAVKLVPAGPAADRELALLRSVRHPFVVPLVDAVVLDGGGLALVLALVEGGSLCSLVAARGHLMPGEVVTLLSPLAGALADLHARGVEHGDVAPGNVLLDRDGRPLLSDLGTVRLTGVARDEVFGTAGYVDPVVLAGGRPTPASDVYGLAAVGWFALTGAPPPAAPLRPPLTELVPEAPVALLAAVEAGVDPDPARRPEPLDFARALHAACRPAPLWRSRAGPDDGDLTRRLRAACAERDGADAGSARAARDRALARHRLDRTLRRRVAVAVGALSAALGAGLLVAWLAAALAGAPSPVVPRGPAVGAGPPTVSPGAPTHWTAAAPRSPAQPSAASAPARGSPSPRSSAPAGSATLGSATAHAPGAPPGSGVASGSGAASGPGSASSRAAPPSRSRASPDVPRDGPFGDLHDPAVARSVVQTLLAMRAAELASPGDSPTMAALPGSPAAEGDDTARASLAAAGLAYRGLRLTGTRVSVLSVGRRAAVVRVTTGASGYEIVDGSGQVRWHVPGRRGASALLHLVLTRHGWRVEAVTSP